MKFRNKKTKAVVNVTDYVHINMYSNNSRWEKIEEKTETKELTVAEIKEKLEELGIEYDKKAKKEELLALLNQE